MVRPNQIAAETVWLMASSTSGRGRSPCSVTSLSQKTLAGRLQITAPASTARYPPRLGILRQAAITGVQPPTYSARSQASSRQLPIQRHPDPTASAWPTDHAREMTTHDDGYQDNSIPQSVAPVPGVRAPRGHRGRMHTAP